MRFLIRWLANAALTPFAVALLFTAAAAPFGYSAGKAWLWPFYLGTLKWIAVTPAMWLTMLLPALLATLIQASVERRRERFAYRRSNASSS